MSQDKKQFKGWTVPGEELDLRNAQTPSEVETLDAISGHFRIFQLKDGHRFSTDDVLTAWYGVLSAPSPSRILDLGSGIGSVATMAAFKCPGSRLVTVEAQTESVRLAKKSRKHNGLEDRVDIREGDFRDAGVLDPKEKFDLVLGSPPYFALDEGFQSEHPQKVACRFEVRGDVSHYAEVASKHLAPGGVFTYVFPIKPDFQKEKAFSAGEKFGMTLVRWRAIEFREGEGAILGLFTWMHTEDLPEKNRRLLLQEQTLTIRKLNGEVTDEYKAIKLTMGFPP